MSGGFWELLKLSESIWDFLEVSGTFLKLLELSGGFWEYLKPSRNFLKAFGTFWRFPGPS